jgi:hypothetical protein
MAAVAESFERRAAELPVRRTTVVAIAGAMARNPSRIG